MMNFATLHEFAIPTNGSFSQNIGSVIFNEYQTLVMTQTGDVVIGNNTYQTIQGYIQVKPLADQYKKSNKEIKIKNVRDWVKSNKKYISQCEDLLSANNNQLVITIEGSNEIQGSYYNPIIFLDVLQWVCPSFKDTMKEIVENHIVEQNIIRQNQLIAKSDDNSIPVLENVLSLFGIQNATDDEVKAPISFSGQYSQLETDINALESEKKQSFSNITNNTLAIRELRAKRQGIKVKQQITALESQIDNIHKRQQEIDQLINKKHQELRELDANKIKATTYEIVDKTTNKVIYLGITEQDIAGVQPHLLRFAGHKKTVLQIIKQNDFLHIMLSGKVVEYAAQQGIRKCDINSGTIDLLFESVQINSEISCREDLEDEEEMLINNYKDQERIGTLMNMRKNKRYGTKTVISNDTTADLTIIADNKQNNKIECEKCQKSYTKAYIKAHSLKCNQTI